MTSKPTRGCSFLSEGGFTLIRTAISHRLERQHRGGLFKAGKPSAGVFKHGVGLGRRRPGALVGNRVIPTVAAAAVVWLQHILLAFGVGGGERRWGGG